MGYALAANDCSGSGSTTSTSDRYVRPNTVTTLQLDISSVRACAPAAIEDAALPSHKSGIGRAL